METLANAKQDFLTGCYTRESLRPYLDKLMAEQKAYNKEFSVLLLDIDHFKPFNDKYGHLDGDQLLKYFASSLRLGLAGLNCQIFRFGGDEFIIVFPENTWKEITKIASMLMETLKSRPFLLSGRLLRMSYSGGIVSSAGDGDTVDALLANADKAMYISKKHGRGRATVYRRIVIEEVKHWMKAVMALAVVAVLAMTLMGYLGWYSFKSMPTIKFGKTPKAASPLIGQKTSTIHMKSGSIVKGVIIKENDSEIELSLALAQGTGSVTLKKSIINRIDRE